MKLLNLIGVSLVTSYCIKVIKNGNIHTESDFDKVVRKALLKDFAN